MDSSSAQELLALVKRNYDEIADDFSMTRNKYLWPELLRLAELAKGGDSILDVGCGNGRLKMAFEGKAVEYVGLDNSAKLVAIADAKFRGSGSHFFIGDILRLDEVSVLENKLFDLVFSVAVLHHIPSRELRIKALKQLRKKAKDRGTIVITVWNMWPQPKYQKLILGYGLKKLLGLNRYDFGDILYGWGREKKSLRYYHAFTGFELKSLVKPAGLKIRKYYKDERNHYLVLSAAA